MIHSKNDLKEYIAADNAVYNSMSRKEKIITRICRYPAYNIMRFKKYLRYSEYYFNNANKSKIYFLKALYYGRKKNVLGENLGIEIDINVFGKGLEIYHTANIVVNSNACVGENCKIHGSLCIGNNGKNDNNPKIGKNVDIGFGARITGDIVISNGVKIGTNAVVIKDCTEENKTLVGVPAKAL